MDLILKCEPYRCEIYDRIGTNLYYNQTLTQVTE